MDFLRALQDYFANEKAIGMFLIGFGIALLIFAWWLFRTQTGGFLWSMLIFFSLVGLGGTIGGVAQIMRNEKFSKDLSALYQQSPQTLVAQEIPRMERVNANWPKLKIAWACLLLMGLVLLFFVKKDWTVGLGLCLLFLGTTAFFVDVFAERRAIVYTQHLEQLRQNLPAARP